MSHILLQIPVNCPRCGELLYKVHRNIAVVGVGSESREDEPICKCEGLRFFSLLKAAERIVTMKDPDYKYHSPSEFGDKVEDRTNRHVSKAAGVDDDGQSSTRREQGDR